MSKRNNKISTLAMSFKKATLEPPTEDTEVAKMEHRTTIKGLVSDYLHELGTGEVDGIRSARELMDVIKVDLLLMGEATEINDDLSSLDKKRLHQLNQAIDLNDPTIMSIAHEMYGRLNETNDSEGLSPNQSKTDEELSVSDMRSLTMGDEDLDIVFDNGDNDNNNTSEEAE